MIWVAATVGAQRKCVCRLADSRALHGTAECGSSGRSHSWGQVTGAEPPTGWHKGVRLTAGWGAWGTAGPPEEADLVWTGAGQADPTPAACVRGSGGGWATGDAAAALRGDPTAGHGQE